MEMKKKIAKNNKTKSWFFEKINKIDKSLPGLIKEKGRSCKSMKLEMKKVTTDTAEIQRIIRDYYEIWASLLLLYDNKMDNVEEMDKFLERHWTRKKQKILTDQSQIIS